MAAKDNSSPKSTTEQRRIDGNSPDAYALWARRQGGPLYSYTQQHVGWAVRCPHCGQLTLLEITVDSEMGTFFMPETCQCGGGR